MSGGSTPTGGVSSGTPYSDALKAVAMPPLPYNQHPLLATENGAAMDKFSLRRASLMAAAAAASGQSTQFMPPYWMQALAAHAYKTTAAAYRPNTPQYPMIYKPKIITQNLQYFSK